MRLTAGRSADAELTAERTNQLSVLLSASVMGRQCSPSFQLNGLAMRAENLRGREADSTRDLRGFCVRNTPGVRQHRCPLGRPDASQGRGVWTGSVTVVTAATSYCVRDQPARLIVQAATAVRHPYQRHTSRQEATERTFGPEDHGDRKEDLSPPTTDPGGQSLPLTACPRLPGSALQPCGHRASPQSDISGTRL